MSDLKPYFPIAEAIALLLHPHGEVVIHDLRTGKIAAIYNNLSKRKVGDDSLIEELEAGSALPDVFPPYGKINWDGRKMKSTTATLRNKKGQPIGLLCMNLDISQWEQFHGFLEQWMGHRAQPKLLFAEDWREKINLYVTDYVRRKGMTLKTLTKEQKQELIHALRREGAFKAKHAATYVGDVLDLSRATIYNYLRNL